MGWAGNWQIWSGLGRIEVEEEVETMATPEQPEVKPFYKRTEWWLLVAALVFGGLLGSGLLGAESLPAKLAAMAVEGLACLGYTIARSLAKSGQGAGAPGYKTSEFWSTLLGGGLIAFQATEVIPQGSPAEALIGAFLAALPVSSYALARGKLKAEPMVLLLVGLLALPGCVTSGGKQQFDPATAIDTACAISPALNLIATVGVCANLPEPKRTTCLKVSALVNAGASILLGGAAAIYQVCRDPDAKVIFPPEQPAPEAPR